MNNKFNNWHRIWISGMIIITIVVVVSVIISVANPQSSFALFVSNTIGKGAPINYSHITSVLMYCLIWSVILVIIKFIVNKFISTIEKQNIENQPNLRIATKVASKNIDRISDYNILASQYVLVPVYNITFESSDGRRFAFQTNQNEYNQILENDTGILTYKENNGQLIFINFERKIQPTE
ncbi:hypothetical protein IMSAG013_00904 [Clostridiales bacterium]|nr:hypothetical protein IMSAG013_00904 [Clostridiales bacterium]